MNPEVLAKSDPFSAPTPGQSLTDEPKKWQWEQPSLDTDPEKAYEKLVKTIKSPIVEETIGKLLYVGVTVETIVNGLSLKLFAEGMYSPDVAELLKPALAGHIIRIGNEAGVTPKIINEFPKPAMSDNETLELLKENNKKEYTKIMKKVQKKDEEFLAKDNVLSGFMSKENV